MYSITKNIKRTSLFLILIGIICLGFGFFDSLSSHVSDKDIKYKVKDVYKKYSKDLDKSTLQDSLNFYQLAHDDLIFERDSIMRSNFVNTQGYTDWLTNITNEKKLIEKKISEFELSNSDVMSRIFHEIEKELHCHFTYSEISNAENEEDIYVATKHYFHAKSQRPWSSILWANLFFLMVSVAAGLWWCIQYVARAGWSTMILRVPQAITSYLPYGGFIMLLIILLGGLHWHHIYHWMETGITDPNAANYDKIIANKSSYLNFPFFLIRSIIYIGGWIWMISLMKKYSYNEDRLGGDKWYKKSFKVAVGFVLFLGLTSTTAAWDWVMSIDPHWFSTLFGWYSLASFFITACAFIAAITIYLMYKGYFKGLNNSHMHDFGRYLLAFSIFWTYLWFAQYMLIWYAHIPEEVVYYQERYEFYKPLLLMTVAINFLAPFLLLMNRSSKRSKGTLLFVAIIIIIGHAFDAFIMVMPGTMHSHWHFGYVEIGTFLGFLGFFILVVFTSLSKRQLVQKNHPMLGESEHHEIHIH